MFHTATFELLGGAPVTSASAIAEVESAEERLGLRLPAAVREWYSCDGAIAILYAHSNDDPPIPLAKFATIQAAPGRLLPFRDENQGVCTWAVLLDGSEDPPVLVDVDSEGREWHMLAPTFSTYVWTCVWDYKVVRNAPRLVQGENGLLSSEAVDRLEQRLHAEPKTYGWPGSVQYRFSGDGFGVLIWSAPNLADWFVGARDAAAMKSALRCVGEIDKVGASLWDCSDRE